MKKLCSLIILSISLSLTYNLVAQTVFVNKTDSKYHLLSCRYLDPNHDSLNISFAIKKGLGACPVCNPTAKNASSSGSMGTSKSMDPSKGMGDSKSMGAPKSMEKSGMNQKENSSANVAAQQCAVLDKDGKRCIGMAEPGSVYCWEHRNYKK
jgi:hypothetical protein